MKKLLVAGIGLVLAMAALGLVYFEAMKRGWIQYNEYDNRSEGLLRVGDLAPDLSLQQIDGQGPVTLSSLYQRRPLVLVFGSYT